MTTLIGCRCKSGNIFSRALLIGRGLFLIEICVEWGRSPKLEETRSKRTEICEANRSEWLRSVEQYFNKVIQDECILCNFQRISWKPRIIGRQQTKVCWWPSKRKPPVPIPNTVVKTLSGDNTWRATAWEDSSLPTSNLNKSEITWISSFTFLFVWIYPLVD